MGRFIIPDESPLAPHREFLKHGGSVLVRENNSIIRLPRIAGGAGFNPDEGESNQAQVLFQRIHIDRDADLQLGLFKTPHQVRRSPKRLSLNQLVVITLASR